MLGHGHEYDHMLASTDNDQTPVPQSPLPVYNSVIATPMLSGLVLRTELRRHYAEACASGLMPKTLLLGNH